MSGKGKIKKAALTIPKSIPPVRRYLDDKHALLQKTQELEAKVKFLETQNKQLNDQKNKKVDILPHSLQQDILRSQAQQPQHNQPPKKPPFTIHWVLPPMEAGAGGHADIFRTVAYLDSKGHTNRLYFHDLSGAYTKERIQKNLKHYPKIQADVHVGLDDMPEADIIFATNWITAYPVSRLQKSARKYYYVQDYEPLFEPSGAKRILAENTYTLGFRGLTLGEWRADVLNKKFGMQADHFSFGVDTETYTFKNGRPRKGVLFYARPTTPRRGFELGILALKIFHEKHPDYTIHLLGEDVKAYKIPFRYKHHGVLSPTKLNDLYNECAAGIAISLSNMSLIPLEMLVAGCTPVVNTAEYTTQVSYKQDAMYAKNPLTPHSLADALEKAVKSHDPKKAKATAKKYQAHTWDQSNELIEQLLIKDLSQKKQGKQK